jgi:hypothetical protein
MRLSSGGLKAIAAPGWLMPSKLGSAGRGKMDRVRRLLKRIEAALLEVQKRN